MSAASDSFSRDVEKYAATTDNHTGEYPERVATTQSRGTSFKYDRNNIYINEVPINKDDFLYAFGGNLTVGKEKSNHKLPNTEIRFLQVWQLSVALF
ncbi:hypothetical protein HII13_000375 [Brettanomyces bruxellensis]|nr:hypothetical protein HII13_000375 [Brettanomyces bruxellensis]